MVWLATKKIDSLRILSQSQNSKVTVIIIYQLKPLSIFSTRDEKWNFARGKNNTNRLLWDQQLKGKRANWRKGKKVQENWSLPNCKRYKSALNCKLSIALNYINFVATKKWFCLLVWLQKKDERKVWLKIWHRPVDIVWWGRLCHLTVCFLIECLLWKLSPDWKSILQNPKIHILESAPLSHLSKPKA